MLRKAQIDIDETGSAPDGIERRQKLPASSDQGVLAEVGGSPTGVERRKHERVTYDIANPKQGHPQYEGVERRKTERRQMDAMRAELQRAGSEKTKQNGFGKMFARSPGRRRFKMSQVLLLALAIISGGMAAFFAMQQDPELIIEPTTKVEVIKEARVQVLTARQEIGVGQRLSKATLVWEEWPIGSVRSDYITIEAAPDALTDMGDALARFEIFPGEPIREQKLVRASQGYLSAILNSGMRGVSVPIRPETASGGFINPSDQVDVILTRDTPLGLTSATILSNVKVLAIGARLGERGETGAPESEGDVSAQFFNENAIVTLELDTKGAEVIVGAVGLGKLSLVLRSMKDFADVGNMQLSTSNQAIRLSSPFWNANGQTPQLR
ncbi:MAG: Flp pilus assembly protein CpaB [Devosiaceae bacterium]|nr:Flp pilus assembly protein CpaB [Devosiaceae bacterium]